MRFLNTSTSKAKAPFLILLIIFLWITNLHSQDTKSELSYLFFGHCYGLNNKLDERIYQLDLSPYDGIWLGGDVSSEASLTPEISMHIDSVFDFSNPLNFWILGNHDTRNGNWRWLEAARHRETFFTNYYQGVTEIVLNTNLLPNNCYDLNKQYQMLQNVCDTIEDSYALILLHHHGIWYDIPGVPSANSFGHGVLPYWNANCESAESTFKNAIYPMLVNVKNRGIKVVCVMGDIGDGGRHKIEAMSPDSIYFLGAGLRLHDNNNSNDSALIFQHNTIEKTLLWDFVRFEDLLNKN